VRAADRAAAGVKVEGLTNLRRTLRDAGQDVQELTRANDAAAAIVATAGRPRTPIRTGRLMATVKGRGLATRAVVSAGSPKRVPYANPIHWGWPDRNITWQPWLSDTARATEPVWLTAYSADVQRIANNVKGV